MTTVPTAPSETADGDLCPRCREVKTGKRWPGVQARGGSGKVWRGVCTDCRAELTGEKPRPPDIPSTTYQDKNLHDRFFLTDLWNAVEFQEDHGKDLLYCRAIDGWFVWNGSVYKPFTDGDIERRAQRTAKRMVAEALETEDLAHVGKVAKRLLGKRREGRVVVSDFYPRTTA